MVSGLLATPVGRNFSIKVREEGFEPTPLSGLDPKSRQALFAHHCTQTELALNLRRKARHGSTLPRKNTFTSTQKPF